VTFNLAVILQESARSRPERTAVLSDGGTMTYAELDAAAGRVAAGLRRAGVRQGDCVCIMLPNVPQFVIAYFAALRLGAVAVPMNVLLSPSEVEHYIARSRARILVAWDGTAGVTLAADVASGVAVYVVRPPGSEAVPPGAHPFEDLVPGLEPTEPDDTAVIIYTAGTTGRPKGAELTHFQLYMCADIGGRTFGLAEDDVVCAVLPMFHVFGLSSILNTVVRFGAAVSLVPRFSPEAVLADIERHRCTIFEGVPTMFAGLVGHPDPRRFDVGTLRYAICGGATMPERVMRDFEERFGVIILEGYGLSETAATACFNRSET
jgi:long-chain acyl-CoA synthetase